MSHAAAVTPPSLPGYRIIETIGSGGFSQVYLYEQDYTGLKVAVKVLNDPVRTASDREQFLTEARTMAQLAGHPNIVQVFQADFTGDGRPYLIMQYYQFPNLFVRAQRGQLSVAEVLRIGVLVGGAVETTHRAGIFHRDIKPHNILTGQFDQPALTDFGIAARKDAAGAGGFSYHWAAPEVVTGASDGDERSDIYSLSATLWHLLAGHAPFADKAGNKDVLALIGRIRTDPVPPTGRGDVPESLGRLLRHGMAKNPAARPQTALDLVRSLQAIEQELRLPVTKEAVLVSEPSAPVVAAEGDKTSKRRARLADPQPFPAADVAADHPKGPTAEVAADPAVWDQPPATAVPRQRKFPDEQLPTRTRVRLVSAGQVPVADVSPQADRARSARGKVIAGLVVAAVVVGTGTALAFDGQHGGQRKAAPARSSDSRGGTSALGPGANAPGSPQVTGIRVSAHELRFTWTYANPAPGDFFKWTRVSSGPGKASGTTKKPILLVAASRRRTVCVQVEVIRSDGSEASAESAVHCAS